MVEAEDEETLKVKYCPVTTTNCFPKNCFELIYLKAHKIGECCLSSLLLQGYHRYHKMVIGLRFPGGDFENFQNSLGIIYSMRGNNEMQNFSSLSNS